MSRRAVEFHQGEYYHIYNRGCNRETIFQEDDNYRYLLRLVKEAKKDYFISVIAYCLMPNHYHFLLRQDGEISISFFMQQVFNTYTKAFNKRYKRSGTLFEERFKAKPINEQNYLLHLCRYIHRNPLEAKLVTNLEVWKFSNYLEWVEQRNGALIDKEFVKNNFRTPDEYQKFVLNYEPPEKIKYDLKRWLFD